MTGATDALRDTLESVLAAGETVVVEPEGFPLLEAIGIPCPRLVTVTRAEEVDEARLATLSSDRVVVKLASSDVLHRSEVGGVIVVPRDAALVRAAVVSMDVRRAAARPVRFTISEFVPHHAGPGGELLASLRWTDEFGPVVTLGPGGLYAEALAQHLRPGDDVAVLSAIELTHRRAVARIGRLPFVRAVTGGLRGQPALVSVDALADVLMKLAALGSEHSPVPILECEVNPLAVSVQGLMALDVLVRVGTGRPKVPSPRPLRKLPALLTPRSVAIAGVSDQANPGRIILRNLLREGFPQDAITLVKPNRTPVDGCRTVAALGELSAPVDLLVLAVAARHVPGMLVETIERRLAESVIVIPGGLEEKAGGGTALAPVRDALARARPTAWEGPIINGGNCLGIRSLPGRIDTLFIPPHKMPPRTAGTASLAIVAQSGAFTIARLGKLGGLNPKYLVTVGNQMDLTVADYLAWLADDPALRVFGVYVEGFQPGDGLRLVEAARRVTADDRFVVLYRAGRTPAGTTASASHTASMAGDYVATRELSTQAGIVVVDSLDEFEDVVRVAVALDARRPAGSRLGAMSNAGFECVAMADNLGPFRLADFSPPTIDAITRLLVAARIDGVVDVHNPLDLTPMADDELFVDAARVVLDDDRVDIGIVGCVPLTPALETLPPSADHGEDVGRDTGVAVRLARLWRETRKPWVAVVDAGPQYDPMVRVLEASGLVTFRTADRALRALAHVHRAHRVPRQGDEP